MVELNDFGKAVKKRLVDLNQNQAWLVREVGEKTGKYIDNAYLQKLMTGRATSEPMTTAIFETLGLEETV